MLQPEYWSRDQNSTNPVRPHVNGDPEVRLGAADRDVGAAYCLCCRQQYLETISQVKADISPRCPDPTTVIRASKGIVLEVPRNCSFHSIIAVSRQLEATCTQELKHAILPCFQEASRGFIDRPGSMQLN